MSSGESVGSCGSFLRPRKLFQEEEPAERNLQTAAGQMSTPFPSPRQQQGGHFRNSVSDCSGPRSGAVSTASDRAVIPMAVPVVPNTPVVVDNSPTSPSFSPWQDDGNFTVNHHACQPTQNTPEAIKGCYSAEGHNGNERLTSGVGGSGPLDRKDLVAIMMDGYDVLELEFHCPCGSGPCIVYTSTTAKNPNRRFYKCPAKSRCDFFKWCDELGRSSQSPLKPSQGYTRSPGKIIKPQSTRLKPDLPTCSCKAGPCMVRIMHEGENKGRKYYACSIKKGHGACNHFEWVDGPVKQPETKIISNENINDFPITDVTTPELEQTTPEPKQNTPEPKQTTPEPKQTLSPYESVKDLFGEHDMSTIEFWCKNQTELDCAAGTTETEIRKQLSPSKRPHQPSSGSELSPMKRLNICDVSPVVENCPTCGAIGQCIECPILSCFKDDDFAEYNHKNVMDGGNSSNITNIFPIEWPSIQNTSPSPSPSPSLILSSSGVKRSDRCFNCDKEGHWSSDCTAPRTKSACFKCGKPGHWMKNCNM